jgi:hypothetical protein
MFLLCGIKPGTMNIHMTKEEEEVIKGVKYQPAISVILPFEPKISLKTELDYKLKLLSKKLESQLNETYPDEKVISVMSRFYKLVDSLDYNIQKKSIAIYVSPIMEKVFYLDTHVVEKIIIDESFEIRDLIYNKKESVDYLVLMISAHKGRIYLVNTSDTIKLLHSMENEVVASDSAHERISNFSDPNELRKNITDKFLHEVDAALSGILKTYQLPVFVMGTKMLEGHFDKVTKNGDKLVGFIHGNYEKADESEIREVMHPYLVNRRKVKQQDLLHQLDEAIGKEKLSFGITNVWKAATEKNNRLLVVEKDFMQRAQHGAEVGVIYEEVAGENQQLHIQDAVDQIIEKVVINGGDVEFVDNGLLEKYNHIALIKYY